MTDVVPAEWETTTQNLIEDPFMTNKKRDMKEG